MTKINCVHNTRLIYYNCGQVIGYINYKPLVSNSSDSIKIIIDFIS